MEREERAAGKKEGAQVSQAECARGGVVRDAVGVLRRLRLPAAGLFATLFLLVNYAAVLVDAVGSPDAGAFFLAGCTASMLVLAVCAAALVPMGLARIPAWTAVLASCATTLGVCGACLFSAIESNAVVFICWGALAGVGLLVLLLVWGSLFGRCASRRELLIDTCASLGIAALVECAYLCAGLQDGSQGRGTSVALCLTVAVCLAVAAVGAVACERVARSERVAPGEQGGLAVRGLLTQLWIPICGMALPLAIRGIKWGEVLSFSAVGVREWVFVRPLMVALFLCAALALAMCARCGGRPAGRGGAERVERIEWVERVERVVPLVAAVCLLFSWLVPVGNETLGGRIFKDATYGFAFAAFAVGAWESLATVVRENRAPAVSVFGLGIASLAATVLVCYLLANLLSDDAVAVVTPCLIVLYLLAIAVGMCLDGGKRADHTDGGADAFAQACASVADEYAFSPREAEVLAYLAKGRTAAFIADELQVSLHTVRSHVKSIHRKLGVDSKEKIIDLVEKRLRAGR